MGLLTLISKVLPGGGAALLLLLLQLQLCIVLLVHGVSISSFHPRSGPLSGGTMIFITGEDFVEADTKTSTVSRCRFRAETFASRVSSINVVSNSTHMTCIMPDVSTLFATPPSSVGANAQLTVSGRNAQSSTSVSFLVFKTSDFNISHITPNQTLTNSTSTLVTIYGNEFLDTGEITCYLESSPLAMVRVSFNSSRSLQCLLPAVPIASRQNLVVSLNGQSVGAIQGDPSMLEVTFYNSPPIATSIHFRPSYSEIILNFDREVEIGPQEMQASRPDTNTVPYDSSLDCSQVLDRGSISMIGERATCSWQNSQQRAIIITLNSDSNVTIGSVVRLDSCLVRTRYALFSRLASGDLRVEGTELSPSVILEVPQIIPVCGNFIVSGDRSLYGGYRDLAYEWSMGSTIDENGNVVPDVSLSAIVPPGFSSSSHLRLSFSIILSKSMRSTSLPNTAQESSSNSNTPINATSTPTSSPTESKSPATPPASRNEGVYASGSGYNSSSENVSSYGSGLESGSSSQVESGSSNTTSNSFTGSGDFGSTSENVSESSSLASGSGSTSVVGMPTTPPSVDLHYLFQLTVRNSIFGSVSSVIIGNLSPAQAPPLVILGGHERSESSLSDILLEGKITGEGWSCHDGVRISGYSWTIQSSEADIVSLEGTRSNLSTLLLPPCPLLPGLNYRATLTVSLTGESHASTSTLISVEENLQARIVGGVRRSAGAEESLTLNGEVSIIELHSSTQLLVLWNCSTVSVPEITGTPSCPTFDENGNLTVSLPPGALAPGGYRFTLQLLALTTNGTDLESLYSQVIVVFPELVPRVQIEVRRESRFHSVLVHENLVLEASVQTFRPAVVQWSIEYVEGYGQVQLNPNTTDGTPLELSVCTSVLSCPFSASRPSLYTAQLRTVSGRNFTNQISLALRGNVLLPENSYRFKLSVVDDLGHTGFSEMDISTESLPVNGRVEITPESGVPLDTVFEARALGWTDKVGDGPFFYRFGYRYECSPADISLLEYSGSRCMQWITGLSLENSLRLRFPTCPSSVRTELVVQVEDRHGAMQQTEVSFDRILDGNNSAQSSHATLEATGMNVFELLDEAISASTWRRSLSGLASLVWSVHQDYESIACNGSLASSPKLNLSSIEVYNIKTRALRHLTSQLYYEIPLTDSHYQIVLSLLSMVTKFKCHGPEFNQTFDHQNDNTEVLAVVEDIVNHSLVAGAHGTLATRGLTQQNIALVLSIYKNLINFAPVPLLWEDSTIRRSLMRVVPRVGFGACFHHNLLQRPVVVRQGGFLTFKAAHTNLPYDYSTDACSSSTESCVNSPAMVSFGSELLLQYLQWECSAPDSRMCSGVCLATLQMEMNLFLPRNAFSSLHKTSILHISLLNPVSGLAVDLQNSSWVTAVLPLTSVFAESSNLECVVWEEALLSWVENYCDTTMTLPSSISCRCQLLASSYISVLERCPSGFYGETCNQSCLQGLWGPECIRSCNCSGRGDCSHVNGSCDCDPGWMGTVCSEACDDGLYGKDCTGQCLCQNGALCDHVTGNCSCQPGWMGSYCNVSCLHGFFGDSCNQICSCSNASQCDSVTGSCSCPRGFTGETCHSSCANGFYGDGCLSQCLCSPMGMRSCDNVDGSCDCLDSWVGTLCEYQVLSPTTTQAPTTLAPADFESWWVVAGLLGGVVAAVLVFIVVLIIFLLVKKRKKKTKIAPVSYEIEGKNADKRQSSSSSGSSSTSLSDLTITRTKSLEVLVPRGKSINELFPATTRSSHGKVSDFEEPLEMNGQVRWQVIQVVSEGEITSATPTSVEESPRDKDRHGKRNISSEESKHNEKEITEGKSRDSSAKASDNAHEVVYRKGVYLFDDATLRELRNGFIETEQLDSKRGTHFQFLRSDVVGDKIDIETEDEVMLHQIEHSLTVEKTIFIEMTDPASSSEDLCSCGKFADLVCTNCNKKGYCSAQCQENDWPQHSRFCREVSSRRERRRSRKTSRGLSSAGRGSTEKCVCGKDAEYECSSCQRQGYCSQKCQVDDWELHEYYCNRPGSNQGKRKMSSSSTRRSLASRENLLPTLMEEPDNSNE